MKGYAILFKFKTVLPAAFSKEKEMILWELGV